jgi:hypothetical protein
MSIVVKVSFEDEKRKFKLETPSFDLLYTTIKQIFHLESEFIIQYIDEDKDLLTISSDLELECALECENSKLNLILKSIQKNEEFIESNLQLLQETISRNSMKHQEGEEEISKSTKYEEDTSEFPNFFQPSIIEQLSNFQQQNKPTETEIAERKMKYKQFAKNTIVKVSFLHF